MNLTIITRSIGALNGASQSAMDLILACNQIQKNLNIIYQSKSRFPKKIDNYSFKNINIYRSARNSTFNKKINLKQIRKWLDSRIFDSTRNKRIKSIESDLVIVNGITGHNIFKKYDFSRSKFKILLIRESPRHFEYKFDEPEALKNAKKIITTYDKYIFVSSNVLNEWKNILNLDNEQCTYIPNCIHENKTKKILEIKKDIIKKKYNFSNNNFNIICVASLQYRKGQDIIIKYLDKLKKEIPNFVLHLVGPINNDYFSEIKNHKNYIKHKNQIKIWGKQKKARELIYASDLFLFATRAEAFPRVILESMALKIPIVSSNVDGISEMIKDNESAILFTHKEYDKMITGCASIYKNKKLANHLINEASKKYWSEYSRQKQINRFSLFLKNI